MKRYGLLGLLAVLVAAVLVAAAFFGGKGDKYDEVRILRRQYEIGALDFVVNDGASEVTMEIPVRNLADDLALQELTVLIEAYDGDDKVFWKTLKELDVAGVGKYSTKRFPFKLEIPAAARISAMNVRIAPDDKGSDFMQYSEFMRFTK